MTSLSGPGASIGIPYEKGVLAGQAYAAKVGDVTIKLIRLDDASDPSAATRNARKLVEEDKVDVLMGTSGVPGTLAMATVSSDTKTPLISLTPAPPPPAHANGQWMISIPQPPPLMVAAVVERMKKAGVKKAAYIGFSDSWGDLVYDGLMKNVAGSSIEVVTNERYARADTSVAGQTLKIVAAHPDAVITGGSGTPGALPYIALAQRGFKGGLYGTHALINPDFIRVGGAAVEGVICPTGPVIVAEQLPDSNPIKKVSLAFRDAYQKANNAPNSDAFSAYAFDGWLVLIDAAKRALAKAQPGTPEFHAALNEALTTTKEVVGTHAVYNYKPGNVYGVDERARVLVQLDHGKWKLIPCRARRIAVTFPAPWIHRRSASPASRGGRILTPPPTPHRFARDPPPRGRDGTADAATFSLTSAPGSAPMTPEIALLLAQDGITTGAIYVLVALGLVLVFLVTRVIFVPFGDVVGYAALTLAALQLKQTPGTVWLVLTLAAIATAMEAWTLMRTAARRAAFLKRAVDVRRSASASRSAGPGSAAGYDLPMALGVVLTLMIVLPISPLLYRIAFQPLADASVLVLLIVAVAVHFVISGMALIFFGPEGFRTQPMTDAFFNLGPVGISGQSILIVASSALFSFLLFFMFKYTLTGKALRATAVNRVGARLVGIMPSTTGAIAFLLASALAGISGILIGPVATLYYDSGFLIGLKAFVGAIIGGLVSYPATAIGAILVGLLESYASFWDSAFKEVLVFGALIPVLLWQSFMSRGGVEEEIEEEEGDA